jgi:hypothetical protein
MEKSARVGLFGVGSGPLWPGFAPVAEAKVVLESLVSEVCLVSDQHYQDRPAKNALQVAVCEFHYASVSRAIVRIV